MIISRSLGCSNHELRFKILNGVRKVSNRVQTLEFRKAVLSFFWKLLSGILRETAIKGKRAEGLAGL